MPPVDALGACVWGSAACAAGCHWRREHFILAGGSCWAARPGARDQTLFCQAGLSSSHSHDGLRARRASTWPLPHAIIRQQPAFPPAHCSMQICTGQLPARAASRSADRHGGPNHPTEAWPGCRPRATWTSSAQRPAVPPFSHLLRTRSAHTSDMPAMYSVAA